MRSGKGIEVLRQTIPPRRRKRKNTPTHRRFLVTTQEGFGLSRALVFERLERHPNVRLFVGIVHDRDGEPHTHLGVELKSARTVGAIAKMLGVPVIVQPYVRTQGDPTAWGWTVRYYMHETADSRHKAHYDLEEVWHSRGFDPQAALDTLADHEDREVETYERARRLIRAGKIASEIDLAKRFSDAFLDRHGPKLLRYVETIRRRGALRATPSPKARDGIAQTRAGELESSPESPETSEQHGHETPAHEPITGRDTSRDEDLEPVLAAQYRDNIASVLMRANQTQTEAALLTAVESQWDDDTPTYVGFSLDELKAEFVGQRLSLAGLRMAAAFTFEHHLTNAVEDLDLDIREALEAVGADPDFTPPKSTPGAR